MKPLVIFHANCADGFGAAFAAWLKFGDEAEYLPCSYGQINTPIEAFNIFGDISERDVYIMDFSFSRETMDWLFAASKRVVWIDHHKTSLEMWGELTYENQRSWQRNGHVELAKTKSGAYLAWEYFHPGTKVPIFIKHIDDYDRWCFQIEGTKAFQKALWSYAPWSFEQWFKMFYGASVENLTLRRMCPEGNAILRAHDQNVAAVVKICARECRIPDTFIAEKLPFGSAYPMREGAVTQGEFSGEPLSGLAANCPPFLTSDVGHELATKSGTFGLCWTLSKTGMTAKCSLRSNGDYDVSAIAKSFGGGGHKSASGFEVPIETLLGWLK